MAAMEEELIERAESIPDTCALESDILILNSEFGRKGSAELENDAIDAGS